MMAFIVDSFCPITHSHSHRQLWEFHGEKNVCVKKQNKYLNTSLRTVIDEKKNYYCSTILYKDVIYMTFCIYNTGE